MCKILRQAYISCCKYVPRFFYAKYFPFWIFTLKKKTMVTIRDINQHCLCCTSAHFWRLLQMFWTPWVFLCFYWQLLFLKFYNIWQFLFSMTVVAVMTVCWSICINVSTTTACARTFLQSSYMHVWACGMVKERCGWLRVHAWEDLLCSHAFVSRPSLIVHVYILYRALCLADEGEQILLNKYDYYFHSLHDDKTMPGH